MALDWQTMKIREPDPKDWIIKQDDYTACSCADEHSHKQYLEYWNARVVIDQIRCEGKTEELSPTISLQKL